MTGKEHAVYSEVAHGLMKASGETRSIADTAGRPPLQRNRTLHPAASSLFHRVRYGSRIQIDLIEPHLDPSLRMPHQRPPRPVHRQLLAVFQPIFHCAVQHHLIRIIPKGEDLLQGVLARLDGPAPQALPYLENVLVPLGGAGAHDQGRVLGEGFGVFFVLFRVVGDLVEFGEEFGDMVVDPVVA